MVSLEWRDFGTSLKWVWPNAAFPSLEAATQLIGSGHLTFFDPPFKSHNGIEAFIVLAISRLLSTATGDTTIRRKL